MKPIHKLLLSGLICLAACPAVNQLEAQTKPDKESDAGSIEIPEAALLTERGRQLARDLRMLLHAQQNMGSKHPSLPDVNQKIQAIRDQLRAWEPAPNPFRSGEPEAFGSPQMNESDLRQVVVGLARRIESLEKRVAKLETEKAILQSLPK